MIYNSINKDETSQTSVRKEKILDTGSHILYDTQVDYQIVKFVEQTLLYDFYGELLTDHQKEVYEQFVLEDLSLGEIAREEGISRQGVHDLVKRCSQTLKGYEEKLHLVEKFVSIREKVKQIDELLDGYEKENAEKLVADIRKISDEIIEEL